MAEPIPGTLRRAPTTSAGRASNAFLDYLREFAKDSYSSRRYGRWGSIFMTLTFMHPRKLGEFEWDLNSWSDEDIMQWKSAHLAACNMTAIASTIIGQLALTALSLPDLGNTHWAARAFLVAAMVLGAFSVISACVQQMSIGMLNQATEIRIWLSDRYTDMDIPKEPDQDWLEKNEKLPLRSSLAAQQLTRMPFALLVWAIACYLVGFAIYLGFAWAYKTELTDKGYHDNRNVLIAFLIAAIVTQGVFGTWSLIKATEQAGGAIDRIIELKISQNTVRKYRRLLELSHIRDTIQPLIKFRNCKVKCDDDKVGHRPQVSLGPSIAGPDLYRLQKSLGDAVNALTECAKALTMQTESERPTGTLNGSITHE